MELHGTARRRARRAKVQKEFERIRSLFPACVCLSVLNIKQNGNVYGCAHRLPALCAALPHQHIANSAIELLRPSALALVRPFGEMRHT